MNNTQTINLTTAKGNTLQLFYNNDTGLVVVDLVAANEKGGNEFVRMTIDENKMLAPFLPKPRKTRKPSGEVFGEHLPKTQGVGYQPKTGVPCSCKPGVQRDNCRHCEGTGMVIDHALIRSLPRVAIP